MENMIPSSRYPLLLVGGKQIGYFTSMAKDLNSGLQRTNPAGVRVGLELGASESQVQCPNHLTTPPPTMG